MKYLKSLFNNFIEFILILYQRRFLILEMAKHDISKQYVGSFLWFFWTFINPLAMIFILWVVFSLGFRAGTTNNVPFVVWLTAAMAAWNAFAEVLNSSTNSIVPGTAITSAERRQTSMTSTNINTARPQQHSHKPSCMPLWIIFSAELGNIDLKATFLIYSYSINW